MNKENNILVENILQLRCLESGGHFWANLYNKIDGTGFQNDQQNRAKYEIVSLFDKIWGRECKSCKRIEEAIKPAPRKSANGGTQ